MNAKIVPRICSINGCESFHYGKGYCQKHYVKFKKYGDPLGFHPKRPLMERFEEKVELVPFSACHWWAGAQQPQGYGQIRIDGESPGAHRVAYELYIGPIPEHDSSHGMCVCHSCDNPSCVNPAHLYLGTNKDNMDDRDRKGRQQKGERHYLAKLTVKNVLEIRKMAGSQTLSYIANIFGVGQTAISYVISRKTWKHVE